VSSASRGRRGKHPQKRSRAAPRPQFRGLDREAEALASEIADAGSYVSGVDPAVLVDPGATRELLARRRFAVPSTTAVIDGEDVEVDPGDEDERNLLIVAEHPEYRHVLEDPFSEELIDGVNPRLHIALHQVIANQLWDDDPPEAWEAARRLLAKNHDRHAILHALAYEFTEELHPTLTRQQAPDPDAAAYRSRLRRL
jgi:hypothetical protein